MQVYQQRPKHNKPVKNALGGMSPWMMGMLGAYQTGANICGSPGNICGGGGMVKPGGGGYAKL